MYSQKILRNFPTWKEEVMRKYNNAWKRGTANEPQAENKQLMWYSHVKYMKDLQKKYCTTILPKKRGRPNKEYIKP